MGAIRSKMPSRKIRIEIEHWHSALMLQPDLSGCIRAADHHVRCADCAIAFYLKLAQTRRCRGFKEWPPRTQIFEDVLHC